MSVLIALLLGLISGIAEILPISGSAHFSMFEKLFSDAYSRESNLMFMSFMYLAALTAILFVYYKDVRAMITDSADFLRKRVDAVDDGSLLKPSVRMALLVATGTAPMLLTLFFTAATTKLYYKTGFVGFALFMTGAIIYVSDKLVKKGSKNEKTMTIADALIIGFAQAVSVIPGLSRTGTTIAVGLSRGLDRDFTVRFSLVLSVPTLTAASVITFLSALRNGARLAMIPAYLAGYVVAAAFGCFAIVLLRRFMIKEKLHQFSYYCFAAGLLFIILTLATHTV